MKNFLSLSVYYFCQNNQTTPFSQNWIKVAGLKVKQFLRTSWATFGDWINFLSSLSIDKKQHIGNLRAFGSGNMLLARYFLDNFYNAYLYFVNLSRSSNPDSNFTFLAFLNNTISFEIRNVLLRIPSLKKISWLSYFPGANLKSLGSENLDLSLILNLDENNLNIETFSEEQLKFMGKASRYTYAPNNPWNTLYKNNYQRLVNLIREEDFWETFNTILNNNFGIKFLFFNGENYNLKNLISSASLAPPSNQPFEAIFTNLNTPSKIEMMKIIFGNKRGIDKGVKDADQLQQRFAQTKRQLLTDLKVALERLQEVDATTARLPINGGKYSIDQLLQATDKLFDSNFETAEKGALDQIKALFSEEIYATDITKVVDQLEKYKKILPFLNQLATEQKLKSLKINDQNYSFTSLLTDANKQFADFAKGSLDELQKLVEDKITLSQLETIYQESTETKSPTQESTNQNLAIGLGTAGGVVVLAGAGGFAYWFLRIKKS